MSLAEFTFGTKDGDFYDVSLVDGFNIPVEIVPPQMVKKDNKGVSRRY